jgi:hypothetical protein
MRFSALLALSLFVASPGCASIISDSKYLVTFSSDPLGANVIVRNELGQPIYQGETPLTVVLDAHEGYFKGMDYVAHFEMPGCDAVDARPERSIDEWYWCNIFFGGLIGCLIVDPATGAMWEFEPRVNVAMIRNSRS